jgi:HD-GYP domain-containing protein (c-di-GMP phosphodiesterase class II)
MSLNLHNNKSAPEAWDVLDRFVQDLQQAHHSSKTFRLLLEAICDSLNADAVFLHSKTSGAELEVVGIQSLSTDWARRFVSWILRDKPEGATQLVRSDLSAFAGTDPIPVSVAMVQVSRSRQAWVIALSFTPGHVFDATSLKVIMLARRLLSYHYQQISSTEDLKETLFGLVSCLTASIDAKDPYTSGHSERVARIAVRLGREMRIREAMISDLYLAGLLHDIGKIGVKDSVLQKAGELDDEELRHVQEHPLIGDRIISNVKKLAHLRPGVRNHHERYDGTGYPDRLSGTAIPLVARILAVADSCDAMMSPRPYRRAVPTRQIDAIMTEGAGGQWDPEIVRHFLSCRHELYSICQQGIGESVFVAVEHAMQAGQAISQSPASQLNL